MARQPLFVRARVIFHLKLPLWFNSYYSIFFQKIFLNFFEKNGSNHTFG